MCALSDEGDERGGSAVSSLEGKEVVGIAEESSLPCKLLLVSANLLFFRGEDTLHIDVSGVLLSP